jgi:AraC family transcriptional regulator
MISRPAIAAEDSYVIMLHLAAYRHHAFWERHGQPIIAPSYPKDSITIVNLMDNLSANVGSPLDALSFYIPRATLDRFTAEADCARVGDLACAPASIDPVLANLGAALLPALENAAAINALFVDRVSLALQAHVVAQYGGGAAQSLRRNGGLTRSQEQRAKHYLVETDTADLSLAGAAATCGLSRSYFSKAFKAATGRTPHRWLLEHRIEQAKQRLRGADAIADIALDCGFTDQSHFTRVFTHMVGKPPGAWRRHCQG